MQRLKAVAVLSAVLMVFSFCHGLFWTSRIAIPAYWRLKTHDYRTEADANYDLRISPALDGAVSGEVRAGMKFFEIMGAYFAHPVPPPLVIVMSSADLNQFVGGGYSLASAGVYQSGVILLGTDGSADEIDQTLVHELGHHYVDSIARGNYPVWYGEGMAQLMEYRFTGRLWFDGKELNDYYSYSISELSGDFHSLPDQISAYRLALALVLAIEEAGGGQAHKEILSDLNRGADFGQALENHTGMNLETLYTNILLNKRQTGGVAHGQSF